MFQVGDAVRWATDVGEPRAGIVRYIPDFAEVAWKPYQILHITCDPKRCVEDHGMSHVAASTRVEYDNPTLF